MCVWVCTCLPASVPRQLCWNTHSWWRWHGLNDPDSVLFERFPGTLKFRDGSFTHTHTHGPVWDCDSLCGLRLFLTVFRIWKLRQTHFSHQTKAAKNTACFFPHVASILHISASRAFNERQSDTTLYQLCVVAINKCLRVYWITCEVI